MELLRRAILVVGLFAALRLTLVPGGPLVRVVKADPAREPAGEVVAVDGENWQRVAAAASALAEDRPPGPPYDARVGRRHGAPSLYFAADDPTVRALVPEFSDDSSVISLRVEGPTGTTALTAIWMRPFDAGGLSPSRLLFPGRGAAPWVLLGAILAYAFLPRRRASETTARYHRGRAVVLPDILATMITGLFLAIPMLVVPRNSPSGGLFEGDWAVLTVVCFAMAGFGLALYASAAWYAALRIEVGERSVRRVTLFGSSEFALDEVAEVRTVERRAPRRLVLLGLLAGLFKPALFGQALILAGRTDAGLEIVLRDGRRIPLLLTALENAEPLRRALSSQLGSPQRTQAAQ
jgi:hypothetical protein